MVNLEKILGECDFEDLVYQLKIRRDKSFSVEDSSIEITKNLTKIISAHFFQRGYWVTYETIVEAEYVPKASKGKLAYIRPGRIDLIVKSKEGWSLAIEIDRSNKKWSLEKIKNFQANNPKTFGVWIRWGGRVKKLDTSSIVLVDLTVDTAEIVLPEWC